MNKKIFNIRKNYSELSKEVKSSIWYTFCNLMQKGIGFIVVPILTRILTTSEYGIYNIFLSWIQLFEIIVTLRLSWGTYIVGLTKHKNDRDRYTASLQSLSICIISISAIIYFYFEDFFYNLLGLPTNMVLLIFLTLYTMPAIGFWSSRQKVEFKYKQMVLVTLLMSVFIPILGFIFIFNMNENKYEGMIYSRLIIQAIVAVFIIYFCYKKSFVFFNKRYWINALKTNIPLVPYYYSLVLLITIDKIMIGDMISTSKAGIYSVAFSMGMVMQIFNSSLNSSIQPWLFRKLNEKKYGGISKNIVLFTVAIIFVNLILIALAPELVRIMAPVEYYEAIWIIPPMAVSVVIMFIYQHFVNIEFYFEASKNIAIASIAAVIIKIILNLWLLPIYGYLVAGYTTVISYIIFAIAHYLFMLKICYKNKCNEKIIDIKMILLSFGVFIISSSILTLGYINNEIRYIFILISIIVIFLKRNQIIMSYKNLKNKDI